MITTWVAAGDANESGSAMGRIALVAVAVLAVAVYVLLLVKARSRRAGAGRRRYDPWDWRTYPPEAGSGPGARDSGVPYGNEESSRPDWRYGYPPGYEPYPLHDQARSPWAVKGDAIRDRRS
jgi:hypothetical protein